MGYTSCIELDSNTANIALGGKLMHRVQSYMDEGTLREALSSTVILPFWEKKLLGDGSKNGVEPRASVRK